MRDKEDVNWNTQANEILIHGRGKNETILLQVLLLCVIIACVIIASQLNVQLIKLY